LQPNEVSSAKLNLHQLKRSQKNSLSLELDDVIKKGELNLLILLCALAGKNGGDGGRCLSLSKAGGKHRFFCPFLGSSFGQTKEEHKKGSDAPAGVN
jgi:hypothetical protein